MVYWSDGLVEEKRRQRTCQRTEDRGQRTDTDIRLLSSENPILQPKAIAGPWAGNPALADSITPILRTIKTLLNFKYILLALLFFFAGCELHRVADEDFTDKSRPGVPDDENGTGLDALKYEVARIKCVDEINAYRTTEDKYPYERWIEGEECADSHAENDAHTGIAHDGFRQDRCGAWAQNECPGYRISSSVEALVENCLRGMWNERLNPDGEQGHYLAMSSTRYTMVACGFYETPEGRIWLVQNYK